jgi:beta-glucosidase
LTPISLTNNNASAHKFLPTLEDILTTPTSKPGWTITFYNHDPVTHTPQFEDKEGKSLAVDSFDIPDTKVRLNDFLPGGLTEGWTSVLRGFLTLREDAGEEGEEVEFEIGLAVAGKAKVWIDKKLIIELWEEQEPGEFYYGFVSALYQKKI